MSLARLSAKPGVPAILLLISRIMSKIWPGLTIETKLDIEAISRDPDVVQAYKDDPLVHGLASARLGTEFERCRVSTLSKAKDFDLPLLLYHGKDDRIVPSGGSVDFYKALSVKDKEFHLLDGGFHEPHNDIDKDKVFSIIDKWIRIHI